MKVVMRENDDFSGERDRLLNGVVIFAMQRDKVYQKNQLSIILTL